MKSVSGFPRSGVRLARWSTKGTTGRSSTRPSGWSTNCGGRIAARDLLRTLPFFAIGLAIAFADTAFYRTREALSLDYSLVERILIAARALWFYAGKLLWPTDLAVIYPLWEIEARDPLAWALVALAVALPATAMRRRMPTWGSPCSIWDATRRLLGVWSGRSRSTRSSQRLRAPWRRPAGEPEPENRSGAGQNLTTKRRRTAGAG